MRQRLISDWAGGDEGCILLDDASRGCVAIVELKGSERPVGSRDSLSSSSATSLFRARARGAIPRRTSGVSAFCVYYSALFDIR